MSDQAIEFEVQGLDSLIAAFRGPQPKARVGIMGGKVQRTENKSVLTMAEILALKKPIRKGAKHLNNAEIGAIHEFGDATHPIRSLLRAPIADHLQKEMEQSGAFEQETIKHVIKTRSLLAWVKEMGVLAEKIVLGAFATDGYGKWASWKNGYESNTGNILVDSTQLRNSITNVVVVE